MTKLKLYDVVEFNVKKQGTIVEFVSKGDYVIIESDHNEFFTLPVSALKLKPSTGERGHAEVTDINPSSNSYDKNS